MQASIVRRGASALRANSDTRRWLDYVRQIPRIDDDNAADLARRFQAGDRWAGEQLVAAHLYVVIQVAMRLHVRTDSAFDLIQEGNAGLLDALHRYEPERGVPFSAYSRYWARARMLAFVSSHRRLVQPGRPTRTRVASLLRELEQRESNGLPVDDVSLAQALDWRVEHVRDAREALVYNEAALDGPPTDGNHALAERLTDDTLDPEAEVGALELAQKVSAAVVSFADTLDKERDQVLFFERIASDEPASLADLGRRFGVSRERARQLEARLVPQFRAHLRDAVGYDLAG